MNCSLFLERFGPLAGRLAGWLAVAGWKRKDKQTMTEKQTGRRHTPYTLIEFAHTPDRPKAVTGTL